MDMGVLLVKNARQVSPGGGLAMLVTGFCNAWQSEITIIRCDKES
jgi:hypothetical protein